MAKKKTLGYYVWVGVNPGLYFNWTECKAQVNGHCSAMYIGLKTEFQLALMESEHKPTDLDEFKRIVESDFLTQEYKQKIGFRTPKSFPGL